MRINPAGQAPTFAKSSTTAAGLSWSDEVWMISALPASFAKGVVGAITSSPPTLRVNLDDQLSKAQPVTWPGFRLAAVASAAPGTFHIMQASHSSGGDVVPLQVWDAQQPWATGSQQLQQVLSGLSFKSSLWMTGFNTSAPTSQQFQLVSST